MTTARDLQDLHAFRVAEAKKRTKRQRTYKALGEMLGRYLGYLITAAIVMVLMGVLHQDPTTRIVPALGFVQTLIIIYIICETLQWAVTMGINASKLVKKDAK